MTPAPARDDGDEDEDLLADLFDTLLQDILDGRTPELDALHPDRPDLRERIRKTWSLACSVAGRRAPSHPVLGGYEILRELGHGGMGTVYLARHQALRREVAIKVLPHALALVPQAKQRFVEEARALAQLRHENVVHVHRIVDHAEMLAFEMEYVDGPSLQTLIQRLRAATRPLQVQALAQALGCEPAALGTHSSVEWFVRLAIKIARALGHVHRHDIVHRDVKPANILLRADGTPVLADFGLALASDLDAAATSFAGTAAYAAPERLRGERVLDGRTDVYSLGVTLYEALGGSSPFAGVSTHDVLRHVETGRAPSLRQRSRHVSRDLATVVAKAMEADPRHRYATADEFADDLERLLALQPIQARPPGPVRRGWQFLRRHRRVGSAALAGAMLVTAILWPLAAHANADAAQKRRAEAARQQAQTLLLATECRPLSWSKQPDGGRTIGHGEQFLIRQAALLTAQSAYERALAVAGHDPSLVAEHHAVAAAAALASGEPPPPGLPPLCLRLAQDADERRGLHPEPSLLATAQPPERRAAGLFAYLQGDPITANACWQDLPGEPHSDPLLAACTALGTADLGDHERAYPRLFDAARAYPDASGLSLALADAALTSGNGALAEQWLQRLPQGASAPAAARWALLAADLLRSRGELGAAEAEYRRLATSDPTDPRPVQRLAELALRRGEPDRADRLLRSLVQRWPDFAPLRRQLARLCLLRRDHADYLSHARTALVSLRQSPGVGATDLAAVLRLGGCESLLAHAATATLAWSGRNDDSLPLSTWLPGSAVAGIQRLLPWLAEFDVTAAAAAQRDRRPLGVTLRAAWRMLLTSDLPAATVPWRLRLAIVFGLPLLIGGPTDVVAFHLLPYQRSLGDSFRRVHHDCLFRQPLSDGKNFYGFHALLVDDRDGDTLPDICVTAPPASDHTGNGYLEFRSSADGRRLDTWYGMEGRDAALFARDAALLSDADGDRCGDLVIGSPLGRFSNESFAQVSLHSGRHGNVIWRSTDPRPSFGVTLARVGDLDDDGVDEVLVGAPPLQLGERGAAILLSGRNGAVLRELTAERTGTWFGGWVACAGDVTGDGRDDLAVGGNYHDAPGSVSVFDGRTGEAAASYTDDDDGSRFGASVLGIGDRDGDGRAELAIAAPGALRKGKRTGAVVVLSSRTGRSLYELSGEIDGEAFGASLRLIPDWRSDGRPALAVASATGGPTGAGYVRLFDAAFGTPLQTISAGSAAQKFGYTMLDLGPRGPRGSRQIGALSLGRDHEVRMWCVGWLDTQRELESGNAAAGR